MKEEVSLMYVELWTYRNTDVTSLVDLEGFDVEATDGGIGKVDAATEDVERSRIVVDTGPWIFGKKVVLPAGTIDRIDLDDRKVFVSLSKDQIKGSPEYDHDRDAEDEGYYDRLGTYYGNVY
jgi:hypothetical protein